MQDTPKEAQIGDKAARDLMLSELLQVCTPAPWHYERSNHSIRHSNLHEVGAASAAIALANVRGTWFEEQTANAKLIALAPTIAAELIKERALNAKLLEACTLLVKYSEAKTTDDDILDLMYANALAAAKSAIGD
jgi:hypothetical protein